MKIPVICITGGPCAGKTSVLEAIRQEFADQVITVPEAATTVLVSYPLPGRDVIRDEAWLKDFQKVIIPTQQGFEHKWKEVAEKNRARLIVTDRGLLDSAAYLPGGIDEFIDVSGLSLSEVYDRYDLVIHLESLATCNPDKFGKTGNAVRYESLDEAIELEHKIREAWRDHPNWKFISGEGGIADVIAQVIDLLSEYLFVETERKYLLPTVPKVALTNAQVIQQWYLLKDPLQIRVRKTGNVTTVTFKGKGLVSRAEVERRYPWSLFKDIVDQLGPKVEKIRYLIEENGYTWELDVYSGKLSGLVTLECEVVDKDELDKLVLPDWAKGAIDVTEAPELKNEVLALNGLPDLSKYFNA